MPSRLLSLIVLLAIVSTTFAHPGHDHSTPVEVPYVDGDWWQVAGNPDLGTQSSNQQQPVDFALWPAADGTWQLWSCIRGTKCGGKGRLLYGWEGKRISDANWKPAGIKMEADEAYGELKGGLQAPHVVKQGDTYFLFYGDWNHICLATSEDGKKFVRVVGSKGKTGLFSEGKDGHARDFMAFQDGGLWYGYYSAYPSGQNAVYFRTSQNLKDWSESRVAAFGGRAGVGKYDAECPQVVKHKGKYYLFRTQKYGKEARTCVYCSDEPRNFGINQDRRYFVGELPIAAPEVVRVGDQDFIAALRPDLNGIQIAKLAWKPVPAK